MVNGPSYHRIGTSVRLVRSNKFGWKSFERKVDPINIRLTYVPEADNSLKGCCHIKQKQKNGQIKYLRAMTYRMRFCQSEGIIENIFGISEIPTEYYD